MADRLTFAFGPERTYEPIDWVPTSATTRIRPQWPSSVRRCSECKSLVLATDTDGHDSWHQMYRHATEVTQ